MAKQTVAAAPRAAKTNGAEAPMLMTASLWNEWMRQAFALSQEVSSFVMARASEDIGALTRLASCRDPAQFLECQQQFAQKAAGDYLAEGQKIAGMIAAAQSHWMNPRGDD
jgi:hypothetical protein